MDKFCGVKRLNKGRLGYNDENRFGESLPEQIAKHIFEKIMKGDLLPGDKIVEEHVSSELNTSRAPVREALYLLQVDNIVERIPRKGTIVKSFTNLEIREYTEVMVGLIQMALDLSKGKWTLDNQESLDVKLEKMREVFEADELLIYQQKSTDLTSFLFEVAENKALSKFYYEALYILTVFAEVKWTIDTMRFFHPRMQALVKCIKENKLEQAKKIVPDLLYNTLD